jgi:hypothetical protein
MREYLAVKLVVKYSEVERGVGGELAWLEDYGAACGQRCRHLALQALKASVLVLVLRKSKHFCTSKRERKRAS